MPGIDSEETVTLIGEAHDRGIWLCRAGMLMENKRLKISRGVFGDEEDYHLVRGEEGGGTKRDDVNYIFSYLSLLSLWLR